MMNLKHCLFAILIAITGFSANAQVAGKTAEGNNLFAFEIFKQVFSENKNVFLSPYSISAALAMTYAGARNETELQMSKVFHFDLNQENTHEGFYTINKNLNRFLNDTTIKLSVANALWKAEYCVFKSEYFELTKKYYNSSIFTLTNAKAINDWVKSETNNKIDELVTDADLAGAQLVLTNAIYFKADWLVSFDKINTKKDKFTTPENKEINADMMFRKDDANYFEDEQNQVLELPYKGKSMSMFIILPKTGNSIATIVKDLDSKLFEDYVLKLKSENVNIFIPKFSYKSDFDLNNVLIRMGMPDAFSQMKADFSGMSSGLYINKVKHKSFIEVNEKGSEATAATVVIMTRSSAAILNAKIFKANRPFIYLIRDNETKSILFIGSILNPVQ